MNVKEWKSDLLLFLAAGIWGFAFVAQRAGMEHVGPFIFNAVRFALGSLTLAPFLVMRMHRTASRKEALIPGDTDSRSSKMDKRQVLFFGLIAGLILFIGASLQQVGLVYTTAGKAGFITGLYVILVPILGLFLRHIPRTGAWLGAMSAVIGLYLLSVTEHFTISPGDLLVLVSSLFWAMHVLIIGWLTQRIETLKLAFLQFVSCSILSFLVAFTFETTTIRGLIDAAIPLLYGGILSVGVAYTLQVVAQREAPPSHAAIILSLETVFAAFGGWLILDERLTMRGLIGCGFMLAGFVISQFGRKHHHKPGIMKEAGQNF